MTANGHVRGLNGSTRASLDDYLEAALASCPESEVCRVARYAVLGGGHRWRGLVAVAAGHIFHPDAHRICLASGAAFEMVHAASLILDDLPSMDNARVRRGKPCAHLVFPAWAVDLAPVFMVTLAYQLILRDSPASDERRLAAAIEVSRVGLEMISGQELDLLQPGGVDGEARLLNTYRQKTGVLFAAATKVAAILCGAAGREADVLYDCGMCLGLCYQFLDDVADVLAPVETTGKRQGMDAGKRTAVGLFGTAGAANRAKRFESEALSHLREFGPEADLLRSLIGEARLGIF